MANNTIMELAPYRLTLYHICEIIAKQGPADTTYTVKAQSIALENKIQFILN